MVSYSSDKWCNNYLQVLQTPVSLTPTIDIFLLFTLYFRSSLFLWTEVNKIIAYCKLKLCCYCSLSLNCRRRYLKTKFYGQPVRLHAYWIIRNKQDWLREFVASLVHITAFIIRLIFHFLYTWRANNCLQIMVCSCVVLSKCVLLQLIFCSCVIVTTLLCEIVNCFPEPVRKWFKYENKLGDY